MPGERRGIGAGGGDGFTSNEQLSKQLPSNPIGIAATSPSEYDGE